MLPPESRAERIRCHVPMQPLPPLTLPADAPAQLHAAGWAALDAQGLCSLVDVPLAALRAWQPLWQDVRRVAEYSAAHAIGAVNMPLDKLSNEIERLDPEKQTYVICQSGYRSSLATSILENAGFRDLYNVSGGTAAWIAAGLKTEESIAACAATKQV